MKKRIWMILGGLLVLSLSVVFAEDKPNKQMPGMMGQGMIGKGMMGSMMEKKIIATQDGGVVIWAGNKLIKYDKDLKLVKEVELKVDMGQMQQQMMENRMEKGCAGGEFKADYPYHHKMGSPKTEEDVDPHAIDPYHHAPKN
jgi:hypothetical protein